VPRIRIGDIHLHYDLHGEGEPLLLITGFGLSSATWRSEFVTGLARTFKVISFDNRGTGRSDQVDEPMCMGLLADNAAGLLDALGIARAHVLGASMGGYIGQELAINHLRRVAGLVLGCTYCGDRDGMPLDRERFAAIRAPAKGDPREEIRLERQTVYTPEFIAANRDFLERELERALEYPTPPATLRRQREATTVWNSRERLHRITAPTLIVTGDRDERMDPSNSSILHEHIPHSRVHIVKEAGHKFWNSHPDETVAVLTEFLSSCSSAIRG
jgi:pimeloyl-ACP methyl ester carboxylesterase